MNVLVSLAVVGGLFLVGLIGAAPGMGWVFGVALPYLAVAIFFGGLVWRVIDWSNSAVPFRIPTTCGQQKSLGWIRRAKLDNPSNALEAMGRMFLEVVFFRSLFRNTITKLHADGKLSFGTNLALWAGAMAFHWSLLIILVRHLRLVLGSLPWSLAFLQEADGFLEMGVPVFYTTSLLFLAALTFLLLRRLVIPQLRYISLLDDYFTLFLLLGIGLSGVWLRHFSKTDIVGVKELAVGLVSLRPTVPSTIHALFYGHLFLVCVLLAYFPLGKLVHMAGVFLSPTRNLANNNRTVRHVNPWDYPVKVHPYDEYEDELRDKMKAAGVPVEKE